MEIELDKTEQKIVDATIFLLDKEGMNGTTTKKIAKLVKLLFLESLNLKIIF